MKSGWKTTEFWLCTVTVIVSLLIGSGVIADTTTAYKVLAFASSALASMGYSFSRGMVKK